MPWLRGRTGRFEFLLASQALFFAVLAGAELLSGLGAGLHLIQPQDGAQITWISLIALAVGAAGFSVVIIRRLHDFGQNWWVAALAFIPLVNVIFWLLLVFWSGADGKNRFGAKSKLTWKRAALWLSPALLQVILLAGLLVFDAQHARHMTPATTRVERAKSALPATFRPT